MPLFRVLRHITSSPLNRDRKLPAIARFFRWQIASRLAPGPIVVPWVGDTRFLASPGEHGVTLNIYCGLHEFEDMAFVLHFLRANDRFVDVGSNVGSYSILACGACGAHGIAFEPVPQTFRRLEKNLRLHNLASRVEARNEGVGDAAATLRFSTAENCMNHVLAPGETDAKSVEVPVVRLDDAVVDPPTMIKIDVEGFETPVLAGAGEILADPALSGVLIELGGAGERYGYDEEAIVDLFLRQGFAAYRYAPFERRLIPLEGRSNANGNTLFVRNLSQVRKRLETAEPFSVLGHEI